LQAREEGSNPGAEHGDSDHGEPDQGPQDERENVADRGALERLEERGKEHTDVSQIPDLADGVARPGSGS